MARRPRQRAKPISSPAVSPVAPPPSAAGTQPSRPRTIAALLLGFAALFSVLQVAGYSRTSATADEPVHLTTGIAIIRAGDFRADPEHPPLLRWWAALPAAALGATIDTSRIDQQPVGRWVLDGLFGFAHDVVYRQNDGDRLLYAGRFMIVLLGMLLGGLVFAWTHEWAGFVPAALALVLYLFEPNLFAHSALVTTDLGLACFMFGACYFLWRTTRVCNRRNVTGLTVFFTLAVVSKYSALLLGPIVLVLVIVAVVARRLTWRAGAGLIALLALTSFVALWAAYGFRYAPSPGGTWRFEVADVVLPDGVSVRERVPLLTDVIEWTDDRRLLPNTFTQGLLLSQAKAQVRSAYFRGEYSDVGWPSYFPVAFLLKTPIVLLVLSAIGVAALAARRKLIGWDTLAFLLLPPALYFAAAMTSRLNIGLRHVLPVYPFVVMVGAVGIQALAARFAKTAGASHGRFARIVPFGVPLLLLTVEFGSAYPHPLAFFNVLAGGPSNGARYLVDSNLDWGQDLKGLDRWMESNGVQHVNLAYFGAADPAYYGMSVTHLPGAPFFASDQIARPRVPGHVAISATVLAGATVEEGWRLFYRPFHALDPVATIGYSIHIYRVDRWPVASLATSGPSAERDVEVAGALALLLDKLGWTEEAIAYYRLYVERHPEDVSALANLGIKLLASGNVAEGVEMFRRAVAADPNDGAARRNLANALADLGQAAEAAPHAERAADLRPGDAGAFTLLGRVRAMQGRFSEAAAALQRALQLAPGDPEASAYLARLRELGR